MSIVRIGDTVLERIQKDGGEYATVVREVREQAVLNTPAYLGTCTSVEFDSKNTVYKGTFIPATGKKLVLAMATDVVPEVAANLTQHGTWHGRIEKGSLVEVVLLCI